MYKHNTFNEDLARRWCGLAMVIDVLLSAGPLTANGKDGFTAAQGAVGDGVTLNTTAIGKAIDEPAARGGGKRSARPLFAFLPLAPNG